MILSVCLHSTAHADIVSLAWDRSADTTVIGYRLSYGTSPGSYPTTVDVGNKTTYTLSGLADGQRYYFAVKGYTAAAMESARSNEVSTVAVGLASVTSDASSPTPSGKPITWKALSGPSAALEYKFWRKVKAAAVWTLVQDYSTSNTYSWTPTPADQDTYAVRVWARARGSTEAYQVSRNAGDVTVSNGPIVVGAIEPDSAMPASAGTRVTWRAKALGGPAPLQYQFWRYSFRTATWTMVRDYSTDNSYAWTPGSADLGTYITEVRVRGNGSTAANDQSRDSDVFEIKNAPPAVASVSADKVSPVGPGTRVTWTAQAAGGPGPLQYAFFRYQSSTGTSTMVQPYGSSNTFSWTPASSDVGTYSFVVLMRRQGSTAAYEAMAASPQMRISSAPPAITAITSSAGEVVGTDLPVTWSVAATGGPGPLQYKFWLYNQTQDVWSVLQDYSVSNKVTWTPHSADAGTYIVRVWVKGSSSSASFDALALAPAVTVAPSAPAVQSLTANVSSATVGTPIVWTAAISGGQGPVEYMFWRYDSVTNTATPVQSYSWDNTFGWIPQIGDEGSYQLVVLARRAGASVTYDSWMSSSTITIARD